MKKTKVVDVLATTFNAVVSLFLIIWLLITCSCGVHIVPHNTSKKPKDRKGMIEMPLHTIHESELTREKIKEYK